MIADVWLASIMDAGMKTDIHPKTKRAAAKRLALLALGHLYGQPVLCDAPEAADTYWENEKITVFMKNAGDGLYCTNGGEIPACVQSHLRQCGRGTGGKRRNRHEDNESEFT